MSYYVIKGPKFFDQYLCTLETFSNPQWYLKEHARRFADAESARKWLADVKREWWDHGSYDGRVVRVNTPQDLKAERLRLRSEIATMRGTRHHLRALVLDEVEHALMNGPIVRGPNAVRTLNECMAAVRALRSRTAESNSEPVTGSSQKDNG